MAVTLNRDLSHIQPYCRFANLGTEHDLDHIGILSAHRVQGREIGLQ